MLSQDRMGLLAQLAEIDRKLAIIVGGMRGFAQVASFEENIAIMVEAGLLIASRDRDRDGWRTPSLTRDGSDFARSGDTENQASAANEVEE